ncbi:hypothetical protein Tco_1120346 [Tanacetum coccineum]
MPDTTHISDSEDTDSAHLPKVKPRPEWLKSLPKEDRPATPEPDWVIPPNELPEPENNWANALANSFKYPGKTSYFGRLVIWDRSSHGSTKGLGRRSSCHRILTDQVDLVNLEGHRLVPNVSKPLPLRGPPGQVTIQSQYLFNKDLEYLVSGDKGRRSDLSIYKLKVAQYLDFRLEELVSSLWIESEREYDISAGYVSLKTLERYRYTYLKEIVLRIADYKEYKILEANFKNLHPNNFKDLYLLHLQGQLNHLSRDNKVHLFNAVNLWIRNIVIRKRVEDLQLRIESYQTKLNLTQPDWDASDFLFKEDYTIVSKPRAVIYRDRNDQKKMMRETEAHKFSDGTLNRILDKLDHMVKDFKLYEYNPGMVQSGHGNKHLV